MKLHPLLGSAVIAVATLLALPARGEAVDAPAAPGAALSLASSDAFAHPVALATLEGLRGGTAVHNDMDLHGVTSGNSAFQVQTGSNSIDAGSFANMSGIPVVIQNSGANVLIQNATVVNLQMN